MTVEKLENNAKKVPEVEVSKPETPAAKSLALSTPQRPNLPQNRPIEPSHLEVVRTYSSVGSARPVTKSTMEISGTMTISGTRPIALGGLQISETYVVMGNRPVASNEIDDASTLMGYLD